MSGILVCVTAQRECESLIRAGAERAQRTGEELHVMHVRTGQGADRGDDSAVLDLLYSFCREKNAQMEIIFDPSPVPAIESYFRAHALSSVIVGEGPGGIAGELSHRLGAEAVTVVPRA